MKHNFLKKLTALLLGTIMMFSMIPAIAIGTHAADTTTVSVNVQSYAGSNGWSNGTKYTTINMDSNITVTANGGGNTGKYYTSGHQWRIYQSENATVEITAADGVIIETVKFTYVANNNGSLTYNGSNVSSDTVVTVNDVSATFGTGNTGTATNGQARVTDIVVTYSLAASCEHANTVAIGTPSDATCTEPGITAGEKCSDCGEVITEQETIEATGHTDENPVDSKCDTCGTNLCTAHVWVDGEVIAEGDCTTDRVVAQICDNCGEPGTNKVTTAPGHTEVVDKAKDATCTETGLTEGLHCDECDEVITKQEIVPMLDHDYVNGTCTACGAEKPIFPTFEKVTSTLDDFSGTYLIVYEAGNLAFNGSLATLDAVSNTVEVTISDGVITGDLNASVFHIEKTPDGYTIKSASGFYIGSTSNNNQLLTSETYYNTISIDANENAIITAESGTTLQFNSASNQMRFRYYKTVNQKAIALYKLVEETSEPEVEAPVFTGFGLTLNKGVTVRVKFNVTEEWLTANPTAKVVFSNGEECTPIVGENTYTTTLTPGQIGDDLTVTLGDVTKTVSVSTYIEKAKAAYATDTKLCTLLDAIDAYGKAAAKVEQTLTAPDFNTVDDYDLEQNASIITGFTDVTLGEYATIGLNINAEDGYTFVASRGAATTGKMVLADNLENGALYIENIRPANFGDVITVTIYDGDTVVSTIDFTFNSYLKLAYDKAETDLDRNIVIAAYNYGAATAAYVGA
ncbi:MAG: hypothetical protein IJ404_07075 [Clostridia bacterium]|nr:hypothetical protein [Clostridia bacterium]